MVLAIAVVTVVGSAIVLLASPSSILETQASAHNADIRFLFKLKQTGGDGRLDDLYVNIFENVVDTERSCEHCTLVSYRPGPDGYAEVGYISSASHDFTGASRMVFFVMGHDGGEVVHFDVAGKKSSNNVEDEGAIKYAVTTQAITLDREWKRIQVDLSGQDLTDITHPLNIHVSGSDTNSRIAFYIKHIIFDNAPATNPIPTVTK